ncbi:PepSY-associated TM helix domain-containing protein [Jongsikchunia kroppenstedtii]|uniref:PepSY-associated TM helix domain-containing protein n=1 Tax=Jongsikchunia kroppenstedtii TaxID=1121721 RepID=UPI000360FE39|nr:PepSY-associated TM helix domain-containing protein [Jongsikchunia kroppenstedtii]
MTNGFGTGEPEISDTPADRGMWQRIRPLILRLHFYGGMLVGPFILIAAITGLLYTLTPQLDPIVFRHELKVDHVGDHRLPMSEQVQAAMSAHPEGTVVSIRPPTAANETTQVSMSAPGVKEGYSKTVFVDPYTADVRGTLTTYGQWLPIRAWFDEFHRNLHLGDVGRNYSELAASWMWLISLGGLAMWVAHRRRNGGLRRLAAVEGEKGSRRRVFNWHGAVGTIVLVGLLGLSVTGLTWSRYAGESIAKLRSELTWSSPSVSAALDPSAGGSPAGGGAHAQHGGGISSAATPLTRQQAMAGLDTVWGTAQREGMQGPMWLTPPTTDDQAWQVVERKRRVPTRADAIAVDGATGKVVDRVDFKSWPFMAKMTNWAIDAHMGILFGIANQIALALLMIGLITVIVRGYRMWWKRRPTRRSRSRPGGLPRAPGRGALAELKPVEAVVVVVLLAVIGWYAPLFGISLAAFVIGDVLYGVWSRRPASPERPESAADATKTEREVPEADEMAGAR